MKLQFYPGSGTDYIEFPSTTGNISYTLLINYDGFSGAPVSQQAVKSPNQHGMSWLGTIYEPRVVEFDILLETTDLSELLDEQRNVLVKAFDVSYGMGALVFTDEDGDRFLLNCISNGKSPQPDTSKTGRTKTAQKYKISLIAHDPFWYSGSPYTDSFAFVNSPFFPFNFPFNFASSMSQAKTITNAGTRQTPVYVKITGPIVNPVLTNNLTGKVLGFTINMGAGDYMEVNTDEDELYAFYTDSGVEENGFPYLTAATTLREFVLQPGDNPLTLTGTGYNANTNVVIEWSDKYTGV